LNSFPPNPVPSSPIGNVAVFANPIAGRGRGRATAELLRQGLEAAGIRAQPMDDPASDDRLAAVDAIIVIGGDGTLRAALRRCLQALNRVPPILLIPLGTANLMGRHLGIRWRASEFVRRAMRSIQAGKISWLDAGLANDQIFLAIAGVGMDASIVHAMHQVRRGPIGYATYIVPTALAMAKYAYTPLSVILDETEIFPSAPAMAFVANIPEYGTGFPLAPDARPDDGLLDVCVIPIDSPVEAVRKLLQTVAGQHVLAEGVVYGRGKNIQIDSPIPLPIQLDGDPGGYTPARIGLLPVRVPFIVPA
jgi:YegS/Rv2252/BmrU family lipid kinase